MYLAQTPIDWDALAAISQADEAKVILITLLVSVVVFGGIALLGLRLISQFRKSQDEREKARTEADIRQQEQWMDFNLRHVQALEKLSEAVKAQSATAQDQTSILSRVATESTRTADRTQNVVTAIADQSRDLVDALAAHTTSINSNTVQQASASVAEMKNTMGEHDKSSKQEHLEIKQAVNAIPPDIKQYVDAQGALQLDALRTMMSRIEAQITNMALPTATSEEMKVVIDTLNEIKAMLAQLIEAQKPAKVDPLAIVSPPIKPDEGKST